MATRIRQFCGQYIYEIDGDRIRRFCGPYMYEISGNRLKQFCGPYVYEFDGNGGKDSFRIYTFNDNVPVGISGGRCRIDFRDVKLAMI